MLPGVSGQVAGEVCVDSWTGEVESLQIDQFEFWSDAEDVPIALQAAQRDLATAIVRRTLEADSELTDDSDDYRVSAAIFDASRVHSLTQGERVLAEYLQQVPSQRQSETKPTLRIRRSG